MASVVPDVFTALAASKRVAVTPGTCYHPSQLSLTAHSKTDSVQLKTFIMPSTRNLPDTTIINVPDGIVQWLAAPV